MPAKKKSARKTAKKAAKPAKVAKKSAKSKKSPVKKTAKKTVKKPVTRPEPVTQAKPKTAVLQIVLLLVIACALICVGAYFAWFHHPATSGGDVVAVVNGDTITSDQLDRQYALLPEQYKQVFTREKILQQLVDEQIIIQYAKAQGLTVSGEEVQNEIQGTLTSGQITIEDLEKNLDEFNLTLEDFETLIERKLYIEKAMDSLFEGAEAPSEEDARAFYDANIDSFRVPEQVRVRHVLVALQRDDAAVLSKGIFDDAKAGADFCELVTENSDDKGSLDNCGEYKFSRGMMVPEFEKASFDMAPGEFSMIQTQFGYHIIEKLEDIPETIKGFDEVRDAIVAQLLQEEQAKIYTDFVNGQKASGTIEIYLEE